MPSSAKPKPKRKSTSRKYGGAGPHEPGSVITGLKGVKLVLDAAVSMVKSDPAKYGEMVTEMTAAQWFFDNYLTPEKVTKTMLGEPLVEGSSAPGLAALVPPGLATSAATGPAAADSAAPGTEQIESPSSAFGPSSELVQLQGTTPDAAPTAGGRHSKKHGKKQRGGNPLADSLGGMMEGAVTGAMGGYAELFGGSRPKKVKPACPPKMKGGDSCAAHFGAGVQPPALSGGASSKKKKPMCPPKMKGGAGAGGSCYAVQFGGSMASFGGML